MYCVRLGFMSAGEKVDEQFLRRYPCFSNFSRFIALDIAPLHRYIRSSMPILLFFAF